MKRLSLTVVSLLTLTLWAQTPPGKVWAELEESRAGLAGAHQEFEITVTFKTKSATQSSKRNLILDMSQGSWREASLGGGGDRIRIFDGKDIFQLEEGGNEFVRVKRGAKDVPPSPGPYSFGEFDWKRAKEVMRQPCGFVGNDHTCVVLKIPLKGAIGDSAVVAMDIVTGLLIQSGIQQVINRPTDSYVRETTYSLKRFSTGAAADLSLFKLPADMHEVKELSRWDAPRINKQLAGKPAPALNVLDMSGNPVSLAAFRGRTVLLDFWTTWCPPCRADGPALEKLNQKYGKKELAILGVSVDEDRRIVEKFLKENRKTYPVVLTTENEMPRPYQIGIFPTYLVIDQVGNVASAAQGDQGFGDLRKLLRKAGMETE